MSIRNKIALILLVFISVLALNSLLVSAWIEENADQSTLINAAGKLRMLSQKMTKETILLNAGASDVQATLDKTKAEFSSIITMLVTRTQAGDFKYASTDVVRKQFTAIYDEWQSLNAILAKPLMGNNPDGLRLLSLKSIELLTKADAGVSLLEAEAHTSLEQLKTLAALFLLLSVVAGVVTFNYLNRELLNKVREINLAADDISQHKNVNVQIGVAGNNEMSKLARSFNNMVNSLAATQQQLESKAQEADQANQAKTEFLSGMSHELRTPLNAIYGFGQLLEQDASLNDKQRAGVKEIIGASKHLLALINDILDLSKVESQQFKTTQEIENVYDIACECISMTKVIAQSNGIKVSIKGEPSTYVQTDRICLKKSLLNLIANAIKYNKQNGKVTIILGYRGDAITICVRDTGVGISEEHLSEIFRPFSRLDPKNGNVEGSGIGLAITKKMIDAMGGTLTVSSTVNEGSEFVISLPAYNGIAINKTMMFEVDKGEIENRDFLNYGRQFLLLYVEDNKQNMLLLEAVIEQHDRLELIGAKNAETGFALAKQHGPDLILLDIGLPDKDGFALLRDFKNDEQLRAIPTVAISANVYEDNVDKVEKAGFDGFLEKPLDLQKFHKVLADCLDI
ncbi:MAG: ATP-binding protein [Pseudomonadales bacterium]|nr:ATP-binding protein [Pseudomonadales bacterium]